jgi:hypothetical protein
MTRNNYEAPGGGWLRTVGFLAPYLTFILCAYLRAILFVSRIRSHEPDLVAVRIENVGGL